MSDVICPYCKAEQEINHADGYGLEEGKRYKQECAECGKTFIYHTLITFDHPVYCQDGDHKMEPFGGEWTGMDECINCDFYEKRKV